MARKHIPDRPSRYAQEGRSREPVKEPSDDHGLDVLGHRARDNPYYKKRKRNYIYNPPAVELEEDG